MSSRIYTITCASGPLVPSHQPFLQSYFVLYSSQTGRYVTIQKNELDGKNLKFIQEVVMDSIPAEATSIATTEVSDKTCFGTKFSLKHLFFLLRVFAQRWQILGVFAWRDWTGSTSRVSKRFPLVRFLSQNFPPFQFCRSTFKIHIIFCLYILATVESLLFAIPVPILSF